MMRQKQIMKKLFLILKKIRFKSFLKIIWNVLAIRSLGVFFNHPNLHNTCNYSNVNKK